MKVAMLDPSCFAWPTTLPLCEGLARRGCEVELIASRFLFGRDSEHRYYRKRDHFYERTVRLYGGRPQGPLRQYVKAAEHVVDMLRLPAMLERFKPDVIHYQQAPVPAFDRWIIPRLSRIAPVILTVHNTLPFHGEGPWLVRKSFSSFLSQFRHLIVHTEYSRRQILESLAVTHVDISVLFHPLLGAGDSTIPSDPAPAPKPLEQGETTVLFFGNISQYKGLDTLIRAFAALPGALRKRTRLLVAGNPRMPMEPILELARAEGVEDRISWELEYLPQEKVQEVFRRASVVALPYRHIDASGVLAHALTYGKPVIASDIGGFSEMIRDGVHGRLAMPGDVQDFGQKLAWMLSDDCRLAAMREAVCDLRDSWPSWDRLVSDTLDIYGRVTQSGTCSR